MADEVELDQATVPRGSAERVQTRWLTRLLLVTLLLETGVVLMAVPWSIYWERNLFFDLIPALRSPMQSYFVRGAISGLGVVNVCGGLLDLAALILVPRPFWRRPAEVTARLSESPSSAEDGLSMGRVGRRPTNDAS